MPFKNFKLDDSNIDLFTVLIGVVGSLLKGLKNKLKIRQLVITMIAAGILSFGTIGILEMFFSGLDSKVLIVFSFSIGWVANELTEVLDDVVRDTYDLFSAYLKSRFTKKK
jgi:uncharacterized membrane protein